VLEGKNYIITVQGDPIIVAGEYRWTRSNCEEVYNNYTQTLENKLESTSDPIKMELYRAQLETLRMEKIEIH
jgi:hypothetical protein